MASDPLGINDQAVRKAIEFVAANRQAIQVATDAAGSSATRQILKEAESRRAELLRLAELTAPRSGLETEARRAAQQIADIRRLTAPLSVESIAQQAAEVLRSDTSVADKAVVMEVLKEQADVRAARERKLATEVPFAQRLVSEARATLNSVGLDFDDLGWEAPVSGAPTDESAAKSPDETPQEPAGIDELIAAIREEGAKSREAMKAEPDRDWAFWIVLMIAIAELLLNAAGFVVDPTSPPSELARIQIENRMEIDIRDASRNRTPEEQEPPEPDQRRQR